MTNDPTADRYRCAEEADAAQWTGSNDDQLRAFCGSNFDTIDPEDRGEDPDETAAVRAHPHGGWLGLKPGDWVVKHADHFSVASDEEFRARWSPAAVSVAVPPTVERRAGYAQVIHDAMESDLSLVDEEPGTQALFALAAEAVAARADAEQAALHARVACLTTALGEAVQHVGGSGGEVSLQTFERWRAVRDAQPDDGQADMRTAALRDFLFRLEQSAGDAAAEKLLDDNPDLVALLAQPETQARRALTPNEYSAAWHAVEGAAGEGGADPGTVLHAVLERLGIDVPTTPTATGATAETVVHAVPLPGSNGISSCCNRPPCEFVGERVTRDPAQVTCTATAPAVVSQPDEEA